MSASLLDYEASFASVFDNIWLQFIEPFVIEMINDPSLTEDKKNQFKAGYDTIPLASTPCGDFVRIKLAVTTTKKKEMKEMWRFF